MNVKDNALSPYLKPVDPFSGPQIPVTVLFLQEGFLCMKASKWKEQWDPDITPSGITDIQYNSQDF